MDLRRWVYTRVTESLPTGKGEWRGLLAILRNEPSADKPYIALDDGSGTVSWEEIVTTGTLPSIAIEEADTVVVASASVIDFDGSAFNVTSSPAGEANIAMAFGTGAGQPAEGSHTHDTFVPFVRLAFNDTGGSTSSTTTYATVISSTFTLPSGTWTVEVNAWGRIGNDASDTVDLRVTIDGTDGSVYTRTAPSTGAYPGGAASSKASVASGSRTALLGIKSTTTGTSTMTNVHMIVNAYRTA